MRNAIKRNKINPNVFRICQVIRLNWLLLLQGNMSGELPQRGYFGMSMFVPRNKFGESQTTQEIRRFS